MKLGLIAGGGKLPMHVAAAAGEELAAVIALEGYASATDFADGTSFGLGQFGKMTKYLKQAGCSHICFAGVVKRPDFKTIKPDLKAFFKLPGTIKAAGEGDDALMRHILSLFEAEGFDVLSPQEICQSLLMPSGVMTDTVIADAHKDDVRKACEIAREIGRLDVGQGAVVAAGVTLAVEAQEGTDQMLLRIANLPASIRGSIAVRKGVLAKMVKPTQDERVDLPTIGLRTIELASAAGLAGIVVEAGRAFIIDQDAVVQAANEAGLFVAGIPPA